MQTASLKMTKKETRVREQPIELSTPQYPWGTRLTLENGVAERVPGLQGLKSGQKVAMGGTAEVTEITERKTDYGGKEHIERCVVLQVTRLGIENEGAFKSAFENDKEED